MSGEESVIGKALEEIAADRGFKEYDVAIHPVHTDGANYTAQLYKVVLTPSPFQHEPLRLFAKVSVIAPEMWKGTGDRLYDVEKYFYRVLSPEFDKIQDKHVISYDHRLATPTLYGASNINGREVMLLGDLTAEGFGSFDRKKGFSWEYAARSVEQLARFHALSFAFQHENPAEYEKAKEKFAVPKENFELTKSMFTEMVENGPSLVRDEFKEKLRSFIKSQDILQAWVDSSLPRDHPVFVHGDYRGSNLMHRRKNGKLEVVPLDYQTIYVGCPVTDLIYFIFTGSDEEFRKFYYKPTLEHYYNELSNMLERLHLNVNQIYPREAYDSDLSRLQMQGLTLALTALSAVCVDSETAPALGADITEFTFKPSQLFIDRLNGIVSDYVNWGLL